jgi:hypothetical protein
MVDRDLQNMVLDRKAKLIIMAKKKKKKNPEWGWLKW